MRQRIDNDKLLPAFQTGLQQEAWKSDTQPNVFIIAEQSNHQVKCTLILNDRARYGRKVPGHTDTFERWACSNKL